VLFTFVSPQRKRAATIEGDDRRMKLEPKAAPGGRMIGWLRHTFASRRRDRAATLEVLNSLSSLSGTPMLLLQPYSDDFTWCESDFQAFLDSCSSTYRP